MLGRAAARGASVSLAEQGVRTRDGEAARAATAISALLRCAAATSSASTG